MFVVLLCVAATTESCDEPPPSLPLSTFAHTSNEEFISKVVSGQGRQFRPHILPATLDESGALVRIDPAVDRFLTYHSDNGWNNQCVPLPIITTKFL